MHNKIYYLHIKDYDYIRLVKYEYGRFAVNKYSVYVIMYIGKTCMPSTDLNTECTILQKHIQNFHSYEGIKLNKYG